ncbi:MAG: GumC family protein [Candidatus Zipacnadales bacterium]
MSVVTTETPSQRVIPPESAEIDLRHYARVLVTRRWWVLGSLAAVMVLTVGYNTIKTPVYEARTTLLVDTEGRPSRRSDNEILWTLTGAVRSRTLGTQIEIVKSRSTVENAGRIVAARALVQTALTKDASGDIRRKKKGHGWSPTLPAELLESQDTALFDLLAYLGDERGFSSLDMEKLMIGLALPQTHANAGLYPPGNDLISKEVKKHLTEGEFKRLETAAAVWVPQVAEHLGTRLIHFSVQGVRDTDVIAITCGSPDPHLAAAYADAIAQEYVWRSLLANREAAKRGAEWVQAQAANARDELDQRSEELRKLLAQSGLASVPDAARTLTERVSSLSDNIANTQAMVEAAEAELAALREQSTTHRQVVVASTTSLSGAAAAELRQRLVEAQQERASLLQKVTEQHPSVAELEARIREIERQLADELTRTTESQTRVTNPLGQELIKQAIDGQVRLVSERARLAAMESALAQVRKELARIPDIEQQLAQRQREVELAEKSYLALLDMLQSLELAQATEVAGASILDTASVPTTPVSPNRRLNLLTGFLVGLLVGLGLALLMEHLDNTFKTATELEQLYGLPVLAVIPRFRGTNVVLHEESEPHGVSPEPYQTLRSNLRFAALGADLKCLLVTSFSGGEGKTTTVANLGIVCGEMDGNIILVDADLRRPTLAKILGLQPEPGLTSLVADKEPLSQVLQTPSHPGVRMLASGPTVPNPVQILESSRMHEIMSELRQAANLVLVDAPPVTLLADAQALASLTDGFALVVELGKTRRPALSQALEILQRTEARCLGFIVNRAAFGRKGYGYDYYYGYYQGQDRHGRSKADTNS